jgi:hypothetical protein
MLENDRAKAVARLKVQYRRHALAVGGETVAVEGEVFEEGIRMSWKNMYPQVIEEVL